MAKPKPTVWKAGPHTLAKHRILREYLHAWLPILGSQHPTVRLVDGFAGPGEYSGGEPGSPLIMLDAYLNHRHRETIRANVEFAFIESRGDRVKNLRRVVEQRLTSVRNPPVVRIVEGSFDANIDAVLNAAGGVHPPTFVFIDPFGWAESTMSMTSAIVGLERYEALIYVPLPYIARFVTDAVVAPSLTLLFGDDSWKAAADVADMEERVRILHEAFDAALRRSCQYVRAFEIRPSANRGYTLFFSTNHPRGLEKMKEVMWKLDPDEGSHYGDSTDFDQLTFFGTGPNFRTLERLLFQHFGRREFAIEDAEAFVVLSTPYAATHLKRSTLAVAEREGRLSGRKPAGTRKRCTYAPGTLLRFVDEAD